MPAATDPAGTAEDPTARRERIVAALRRSTGQLSTAAMTRMDSDVAWFRELSAQDRSWVGLVLQAGIKGFVQWYAGGPTATVQGPDLASSLFGAAPRALAGVITLQQTVDLIRLSIEVVEANIDGLLDPADGPEVHAQVGRYAREVAFATAEVYARAAEVRGAWDARLEALVVDAVLRGDPDEALLSRVSALGWSGPGALAAVIGHAPRQRTETDVFQDVRRLARSAGLDALCAMQGGRLVVLLRTVDDPRKAAEVVEPLFAPGPVVAGPVVPDLTSAYLSTQSAVAAHRAADGWPDAPRPVLSSELLPERALAGDDTARRYLVDEVYRPLVEDRGALTETLTAYLAAGGALEATSRQLFVHVNTVRYRLRQVEDVTGLSPTRARDAFTLHVALVLGRQDAAAARAAAAGL